MAAIAVIGAGLTGLTAAYRLKQRGNRVVVYEASDRIGGSIKSERRDGYLAELGPRSLAAPSECPPRCSPILVSTRRGSPPRRPRRNRYIVRRGRLVRLPMSPAELLTSRLLSNGAKLAIFGEPLVEVGRLPARGKCGGVRPAALQPGSAGLHRQSVHRRSLRRRSGAAVGAACDPKLHALERTHGSVMKALVQMMKARREGATAFRGPGRVISFRNGLQEIPDALGRRAQQRNAAPRAGHPAAAGSAGAGPWAPPSRRRSCSTRWSMPRRPTASMRSTSI